jgi:membrane protease YdiL (CAAX protease family)
MVTRPPGFSAWLAVISVTQLVVGTFLAWRRSVSNLIRGAGPWWSVWVAGLGLQAAEWLVIQHHLPQRLDLMVVVPSLVRYTVMIGLAEEIWFRGLWFHCCKNRFWPSVAGGAALFGLYHSGSGWIAVGLTTAIGFLFGVARHRGASIAALAVLHGTVDTINRVVMPGYSWRFSIPVGVALFVAVVMAAVLLLVFLPPTHRVSNSPENKK